MPSTSCRSCTKPTVPPVGVRHAALMLSKKLRRWLPSVVMYSRVSSRYTAVAWVISPPLAVRMALVIWRSFITVLPGGAMVSV